MVDAPIPTQTTPAPAPSAERLPPVEYPVVSNEISSHSLRGIIAAGIGGIVGWLGGLGYATLKMLNFEKEYLGEARKDFMGKGGVGAAAADGMPMMDQGMANGFGGLGRGMASHEITEFHRINLLNSGKHPFPKMMEVLGGKGTFGLLTGAVGALAGYVGYKALAPKETMRPAAPVAVPVPAATELPPSSPSPMVQEVINASKPQAWAGKVETAAPAERAPGV